MPALPSNCYRTPHSYIFRIVVPELLRSALGKRETKKSLGNDYREALSQARLLALQVDKQFADLYEQQSQQRQAIPASPAMPPVADTEYATGVRFPGLQGNQNC